MHKFNSGISFPSLVYKILTGLHRFVTSPHPTSFISTGLFGLNTSAQITWVITLNFPRSFTLLCDLVSEVKVVLETLCTLSYSRPQWRKGGHVAQVPSVPQQTVGQFPHGFMFTQPGLTKWHLNHASVSFSHFASCYRLINVFLFSFGILLQIWIRFVLGRGSHWGWTIKCICKAHIHWY